MAIILSVAANVILFAGVAVTVQLVAVEPGSAQVKVAILLPDVTVVPEVQRYKYTFKATVA